VLHRKEQVAQDEKLELEPFPPKQKLQMLQSSVDDVNELAYVKQIGDQDIAHGNPPLDVDSYLELLLSACSTYDKNHATLMKKNVMFTQRWLGKIMTFTVMILVVMNDTMKGLQWIRIYQKS
jgi:hypothetical protein